LKRTQIDRKLNKIDKKNISQEEKKEMNLIHCGEIYSINIKSQVREKII
jgi:hypothetical protein